MKESKRNHGRAQHDIATSIPRLTARMKTESIKAILLMAVVGVSAAAVADSKMERKDSCEDAASRAVAFLRNAHTGKAMVGGEWMTSEALDSPMFSGFGGIDALVRQSTDRAKRYGGLKSVTVQSTERIDGGCKVIGKVEFSRDHREPENPAVAANEDMVWTFQMFKMEESWKIGK